MSNENKSTVFYFRFVCPYMYAKLQGNQITTILLQQLFPEILVYVGGKVD